MKRVIPILMLAIFTLFITGCRRGRETPREAKERSTAVIITHPIARMIERKVRFSGVLTGIREATVYPPLQGKFIGYTVSEGTQVSQGTKIADMDRDVLGVEYEPVPVKAPISGRFFSFGISPGVALNPQTPIAKIAETSKLKLEFNIPEKYAPNVKPGTSAELFLSSSDLTLDAKLSRVSRFIDPLTGSAQAEAIVDNQEGRLNPGMYAEVYVIVASKKAELTLPIDCVLGIDGKFVYLARNGKSVRKDVEVGLQDELYIEIISGLSPTDSVLYVGQMVVDEGSDINIQETYMPSEE